MARKTHDAVATVGTYKDRQTGEEKKRTVNIGAVFTQEDGRMSLKLDVVPVSPEWSGWVSLYPVEDGKQAPRPQARPASSYPGNTRGMPPAPQPAPKPPVNMRPTGDDDDIPF